MKSCFFIGYKGRLEAYIYIWFSKKYRFVYIGETNNRHGVVGRANDHVSTGGTLYSRVAEQGYDLDEIDDFILLSFPLPREKKFSTSETAYRISVEYLVQQKIILINKNSSCPYQVISYVTPGPNTGMKRLKKIADDIVKDFFEVYEGS